MAKDVSTFACMSVSPAFVSVKMAMTNWVVLETPVSKGANLNKMSNSRLILQ